MRTFRFRAKAESGKTFSGKLKADSRTDVIERLNSKNLEPISIHMEKSIFALGSGEQTVKLKSLVEFTRQLAFLVKAGIPIVQGLQIVREICQSMVLKQVTNSIIQDIKRGQSLSEALANYPSVFGQLFVSLIRSGETSGNLDRMLEQLAGYIEQTEKIRSRVMKAMMYPGFILLIGVSIVTLLIIFVVPQLAGVFLESNVELPIMTQLLLSASSFLGNNLVLVAVVFIVLPFVGLMYLRSPSGRVLKDQIIMMLPIFGGLAIKNSIARFTRTLSCLMASGVNILEALDTSSFTANNFFIETAIQRIRNQVGKGDTISNALKNESVIPPLVSHMVAIGEESGNVDATLEKVAEFYEEQVSTTADSISDLINPFLIVVLGVMVGFIVISLYLPIFKMAGVVSGV